MKVQCPNCSRGFEVPNHYLNKKVKCSKCLHTFIALSFNPITVNSDQSQKHNIFLKFWNRSPVPFRTAFLATLGVVSALAFAYYLMSVPKLASKKTVSMITSTSSTQMVKSQNIQKLASVIILNAYTWKYDELFWILGSAMDKFIATAEPAFIIIVSMTTQARLDELYMNVHKLKLPSDDAIQSYYKALLDAVDTDYNFQKTLQSFMANSDNLYIKSTLSELSKTRTAKHNEVLESCWQLLNEIDPDLVVVTNSIVNYESK